AGDQCRHASHARRLQRLRRTKSPRGFGNRVVARQCHRGRRRIQGKSRGRPLPQAERLRMNHDFVELSEDVSASPLWNRDLAPTTIRERTWSTWNIAALWIGMSVVITTYTLAGGFIEAGMNWWQAMITI